MALDEMTPIGLSVKGVLERVGIARHEARRITLHSSGFLQLALDYDAQKEPEGYRLHVWPEQNSLPPSPFAQLSALHDHTFGIDSYVLLGALRNTPFNVALDNDGAYHFMNIEPDKELHILEARVRATPQRAVTIPTNSFYHIKEGTFHITEATTRPTVTIIHKKDPQLGCTPRLLVLLDCQPPQLHVDKAVDQHLAWQIINDVTEKVRAHYEHHS